MAIFKDKTGRGEVNYAQVVQSDDGTSLNINSFGDACSPHGVPAQSASSVVFQLRGNSNGVEDVSNSSFTVNEISGSLTKRLESVTHTQKLKSFEFSGGKVLTLTASLDVSNFEDLNVIPSGDSASDKFGSTYLPYGNEGHGSYSSISPGPVFCVLSGWIYLNDSGTAMCVMESVNESDGKRAFGLATSSNNELIWRYYDWNHSSAHTSSTVQQVKTTKKLNPKKWYHFAIIFFGYAGSSETARVYNSNGLDERHQLFVSPSAARVATTADLAATYNNGSNGVGATLTADANGAIAIDGVSLSANDRVLVKSQDTNREENGIYKVTTVGDGSAPFVLTRTTDADTPAKLQSLAERSERTRLVVTEGASNADAGYVITGGDSITAIGTSPIFFSQFSSVGNPSLLSGAQVEIYIDGAKSNVSEYGATSGTIANGVTVAASNLPIVIGRGLTEEDGSSVNTFGTFSGRLAEISYFYFYLEALLDTGTNVDSRGFEQDPRGPQDWESYKLRLVNALKTGKKTFASGISNPPERLLLREIDKHSSHPTVKRSGDQRRLGNHAIRFDDGRAQTFKGATVSYPQKLVPGDQLFDTIFNGYPGTAHNLTIAHTASVESYDTFYRRNDQPAHEPFVESRIYIDSGSIFYQTGTLESVLPGFSGPLQNKSSFTIDLTPSQTTELDNGNIALGSAARIDDAQHRNMNLMAYYNFDRKVWEPLHHSKAPFYVSNPAGGNAIDWANAQADAFVARAFETRLGFSPLFGGQTSLVHDTKTLAQIDSAVAGDGNPGLDDWTFFDDNAYNTRARPTDFFGFPAHAKYHATGSCELRMSEFISEPFLLEKIEYTYYFEPKLPRSSTGKIHKSNSEPKFLIRDATGIGNDNGTPSKVYGGESDANNSAMYFNAHSFFILRQSKGVLTGSSESKTFNSFISSGVGAVSREPRRSGQSLPATIRQSFAIPASVALVSGSSEKTLVEDFRELIAYGQHVNHGYNDRSSDNPAIGSIVHDYFATQDRLLREVNVNINTQAYRTGLGLGLDFHGHEDFQEFTMRFTPRKVPKFDFGALLEDFTGLSYQGDYSAGFSLGSSGGRLTTEITSGRDFASGVTGQLISGSYITEGGANVSGAGGFALPVQTIPVSDSPPFDQATPYVLMPEDKLIFGWQCPYYGVDSLFTDVTDPHQGETLGMRLKPKNGRPQKITFFGSFLGNSQPRQFQLNQMLNNDIVHEAIGMEPIADQFDVEPRGAFTGSYVDEVMSGSSIGPLYNGFNALSYVSGPGSNAITNLARGVGGRSSQGNLATTGSLRRNVAIASSDKTEFDSFLFDLESVFKIDKREGTNYTNDKPATNTVPKHDEILLGDGAIISSPGEDGNRDIGAAFYHNRYHSVTRVRSTQIGARSESFKIGLVGQFDIPGLVDPDDLTTTFSNTTRFITNRIFFSDSDLILGTIDTAKVLFGIGEGRQNAHIGNVNTSGDAPTVEIEKIRGFRYGFSNIFDKKPRNIFRRDRYGQFRDMLEMAPNTAYIDDNTNTIVRAIEAQFFADDGSIASPEATSCSNLSTFVTSSAPFFDREVVNFEDTEVVRNRGPLNNKVADITIEI